MKILEGIFIKLFGHYPRWYVRFMNYYTGFEIPITILVAANGHNKKEAQDWVNEEVLPEIKRALRDLQQKYHFIIK